ncbi:MAG: 2-hydroxymuconate tautomerase family protein [Rhodobacteraceae bacterium]|nr:2-hydroxymuconate tautomerase family protein [Paracoccaceae bacterium]
MAIITVEILEGRPQETRTRLMERITDAFVEVLDAKPEQVRVVIHELPRGNYAVAGKPV